MPRLVRVLFDLQGRQWEYFVSNGRMVRGLGMEIPDVIQALHNVSEVCRVCPKETPHEAWRCPK